LLVEESEDKMWGFHSSWKVIPESRKPFLGDGGDAPKSAYKLPPNIRVFSEL